MSTHQIAHARGDAAGLLRRIERHVPFAPGRVVFAMVRVSRAHVVRASWVDSPQSIERAIGTGRAEEGRADKLRTLVADGLAPLAVGRRSQPEAHVIVMVRCRLGRVVWLPSDLAWLAALRAEAEWSGLTVAESYCVTEHGWRTRTAAAAGSAPALAA